LLLYPYEAVPDIETQNRILELVQARLQGELGIKRYLGDSYYCQDYEELFTPEERSADFSASMDYRNSLLVPGREAQWCLFDPLLSVIYGRRALLGIDIVESKDRQAYYFQRAIAPLDENLQCPELYFWRHGKLSPNGNTPLAWTQANLRMALFFMKKVAARIG
jgi:hypothetical protein